MATKLLEDLTVRDILDVCNPSQHYCAKCPLKEHKWLCLVAQKMINEQELKTVIDLEPVQEFIRTKDGRIYDSKSVAFDTSYHAYNPFSGSYLDFMKKDIYLRAPSVEGLIRPGDLVSLKDYSKSEDFEPVMIRVSLLGVKENEVDELYLKQNNGDYKLVAKRNDKGALTLK